MGKRKIISEEDFGNIELPVANDVSPIAIQMLDNDRIRVKYQGDHRRLCRIRSKMKRQFWIRKGDIFSVSPWDFQSNKLGDIYWRHRRNETEWLKNKDYLTVQR